jgi:hypothetical protein
MIAITTLPQTRILQPARPFHLMKVRRRKVRSEEVALLLKLLFGSVSGRAFHV